MVILYLYVRCCFKLEICHEYFYLVVFSAVSVEGISLLRISLLSRTCDVNRMKKKYFCCFFDSRFDKNFEREVFIKRYQLYRIVLLFSEYLLSIHCLIDNFTCKKTSCGNNLIHLTSVKLHDKNKRRW